MEKILSIIKNTDNIDKKYSKKIHSMELPKLIEILVYLCARIFNPDFVAFYFSLIFANSVYYYNDYYFVLKPLTHVLVCLIVSLTLKKSLARDRPTVLKDKKRINDLRKHEKNCSMPSGDSIQAANFAIILYFYFNSCFGFYLVPLVMFARIFYFCHYIADTIVGALLGAAISYYVYNVLNFI